MTKGEGEDVAPDEVTPEQRFVSAMRTLRIAKGWSQERLASEVHDRTGVWVSPSAITKLEWLVDPARTESRSLRLNEAFAIARALGSDVVAMVSADSTSTDEFAAMITDAMEKLAAAEVRRNQITAEIAARHADLDQVQAQISRYQVLVDRAGTYRHDADPDASLGDLTPEESAELKSSLARLYERGWNVARLLPEHPNDADLALHRLILGLGDWERQEADQDAERQRADREGVVDDVQHPEA